MSKHVTDTAELTQDERQQLRLWLSATPMQRLAWLEEAQKIAKNSGALERYRRLNDSEDLKQ